MCIFVTCVQSQNEYQLKDITTIPVSTESFKIQWTNPLVAFDAIRLTYKSLDDPKDTEKSVDLTNETFTICCYLPGSRIDCSLKVIQGNEIKFNETKIGQTSTHLTLIYF